MKDAREKRGGMRMVFFVVMCKCLPVMAMLPADSLQEQTLQHVTVEAVRTRRTISVAQPTQTLQREELEGWGVKDVADAVRRFAGATVKDYGGIGGLKTVSVRGLGAEHTAVAYDGVAVSNCQAGQIDLGRFQIDDVETLTFAIGQQNDLLQSARLYASAGVLAIRTRHLLEGSDRKKALAAQFTGGSFGLVRPSLKWAQRVGERTTYALHASLQRADGSYPFTLKNGRLQTRERRHNSDVFSWNTEANLYHTFKDYSRLEVKTYYYDSERGLPGSVILYNPQANERLWDRNGFVQARYRKTFSRKWRFQAEGKYNYSWNRYEDTDVKYIGGKQTDLNTQQEYYLSVASLYTPVRQWSFSWSNDGVANTLRNNYPEASQPVRLTWLSALNARWASERITVHGTLLSTWLGEQVKHGRQPDNRYRLTPSVSLLYRPFTKADFYLRLLYKDTFRVPTFNDLYYQRVGNRSLRPEKAHEYNAGLTWGMKPAGWFDQLQLTVDGYYNDVDDKIVAIPTTYVWKMYNYGEVRIWGADVSLRSAMRWTKDWGLLVQGSYAFQDARDYTDAEAKNYRHQIPYTPKHTGNVGLRLLTPWLHVGYSVVAASDRYCMKQNLPEYRVDGYNEHAVTVSRTFHWHSAMWHLQAEILNMTDTQYDIIRYYPMPGRSYRLSVRMEL